MAARIALRGPGNSAVLRMGSERQAKRFFVSGIVQGVGFRFFAHRAAARRGLAGYAKNLCDGRVEVYAIGSQKDLSAFRADLERGPAGASVAEVAEEEAPLDPKFQGGFSIEHEW